MSYNTGSGMTAAELFERAVAALSREWGVSDVDARDAIMRVRERERRLGPEIAHEWVDGTDYPPEPRAPPVIDLTAERCDVTA